MLLHGSIGQPQAESSALVFLRRIKRLKDVRQVLWLNAAAGIGNGDAYSRALGARPGMRARHSQPQAAAILHGVHRVQE